MGLKSYIRNMVVNAVQFAVREELQNQKNSLNSSVVNGFEDDSKEEIIQRLDKQIERWTWERFKRTDKLFDDFGYVLDADLGRGLDRLDRKLSGSLRRFDEQSEERIEKIVDEKVKFWTAKRFDQTDKQIERWTWERYKRSEEKLLYVYKLQIKFQNYYFNKIKLNIKMERK